MFFVPLDLPVLDDTWFLVFPPRRMVYHLSVFTLGTFSRLLSGNREPDLKPITFSSFLLFRVFLVASIFLCCYSSLLVEAFGSGLRFSNLKPSLKFPL